MHLILFLVACVFDQFEEQPRGVVQANMEKHVKVLSSDEYLGRGTFELGLDKAAEYITAEFQRYGLQTVDGSDSFVVPYTLYQYKWETNSKLTIVNDNGSTVIPNTEWRPFKFENKYNPNHTTRLEDASLVLQDTESMPLNTNGMIMRTLMLQTRSWW